MCFGKDRLDMEQPVGIWPFLFFNFSQLLVAGGAEWAVVNSGRTPGGCGASSLLWAGAQEVGNECVRSRE